MLEDLKEEIGNKKKPYKKHTKPLVCEVVGLLISFT